MASYNSPGCSSTECMSSSTAIVSSAGVNATFINVLGFNETRNARCRRLTFRSRLHPWHFIELENEVRLHPWMLIDLIHEPRNLIHDDRARDFHVRLHPGMFE